MIQIFQKFILYSPFNKGKGCNSTSEQVRYREDEDEPCERFVLRFNTDILVNGSMRSTNVAAAPVVVVVVAAVFDMLYCKPIQKLFLLCVVKIGDMNLYFKSNNKNYNSIIM